GRRLSRAGRALGRWGTAWREAGIRALQLPERSDGRTRDRLRNRVPTGGGEAPPPPSVRAAIAGIVALLRGERGDLSGVALEMNGLPPFDRAVYQAARTIPAGSTLTYGEVASLARAPGEGRAVGQALGRNPFAIVVPCHRAVAAGGSLGGVSAPGGTI